MKKCQDIPLNPEFTVVLFYKYTSVEKPEDFTAWTKELCIKLGLTGRVLIAKEGINATLEGQTSATEEFIQEIRNQKFADLSAVEIKTSIGTGKAFRKLKVKVKPEIVALGLEKYGEEDVDPNELTGIHLKPADFKKMYDNNEDFVVIDMRNDYEFKVGHFKDSINPPMENFRELPKVLPQIIEQVPNIKDKKVITVCTGGVRCEKASGYLMKKGFKDVYQLDGGMHMFMEEFKGKEGEAFRGGLFTFDDRVVMDFTKDREIIGACDICKEKTERFDNCVNDECHKHMLVCHNCAQNHIYVWCSKACKEEGRSGDRYFKDMEITNGAIAK